MLSVLSGLILGVFAAFMLPVFVLAAKGGYSRRTAIIVTVDVFVMFAGIAVNYYFPHWGDAAGGSSTADGWVFLAVTLAAGGVAYVVLWRLYYLDRMRRWLAGPSGAQPKTV